MNGSRHRLQVEWLKDFGIWLKSDLQHGMHCTVCIKAAIKASDKLSTTGYGYVGKGDDCVLVPVPSRQKLEEHAGRSQHKLNMKTVVGCEEGRGGQAKFIPSVSFEDELYARTVRTVHTIAVRQLSLNDMYNLLELQNANGTVISFDHASVSGGEEAGGIIAWLEAGARTFQAQTWGRVQNPIMRALFPKGVPLGFMGDGSNDRSLAEQEAVVLRYIGADGRPFNTFFDLAELDLTTGVDGHSPDAQCIAACYAKSLNQLNSFADFLFCSDWKQATVGMSFDGASVMLGKQGGAAAKLGEKMTG